MSASYCTGTKLDSKFRGENSPEGKRARRNVNTAHVGALGELLVSVDLMRRGYQVFRALSPGSSCDMLVLKNNTVQRVEVTKGSRHTKDKNKLWWPKHDPSRYDILVVWEDSGLITYPEQQPI